MIEDSRQVLGEVADSSAVYVYDLGFDGRRFVTACSQEHLAVLRERYRRRPFVVEELWWARSPGSWTRTPTGSEAVSQPYVIP
ncbi:hypothetical protein ACIGW8_36840 [Streptomyces sioyaensis]|uniref:hypothetical protein n=1 Tax=Streptomyces sioyaensis TaxID=67364 RepID=UPI0037D46E80